MGALALAAVFFAGPSFAEGLSGAGQQEISHLFAYLANSGCHFNRNGSWHGAQEAVDHLSTKYQYLLKKNQISSAEDFIAQAASRSSMSGKPYLVKCGDAAPVESARWFLAELENSRKATATVPGKH